VLSIVTISTDLPQEASVFLYTHALFDQCCKFSASPIIFFNLRLSWGVLYVILILIKLVNSNRR
jgi:hypothetical protein